MKKRKGYKFYVRNLEREQLAKSNILNTVYESVQN